MIQVPLLYEIASLTTDPCSIAKDAHEEARKSWLCIGCAQPKRGVGAVDIKLQQRPKDIPLNFAYGVSTVQIIRRDFFRYLGDEAVRRALLLGKVFDSKANLVSEFATVRARTTLAIRGEERSTYRRCDVCGRHLYYPLGKRYVLPAPEPALIYGSQLGGLIVGDEIVRQVNSRSWRELSIQKLPVLDAPIDGKPLFYSEDDP